MLATVEKLFTYIIRSFGNSKTTGVGGEMWCYKENFETVLHTG